MKFETQIDEEIHLANEAHKALISELRRKRALVMWDIGREFFTIDETAILLNLNGRTIRNMTVANGALQTVRISNRVHITRSSIITARSKPISGKGAHRIAPAIAF